MVTDVFKLNDKDKLKECKKHTFVLVRGRGIEKQRNS